MNEDCVKAAFKEWLRRLSGDNHWMQNGEPVHTRIAEYFGLSRQVVGNWLNGTSMISTQVISGNICPQLELTHADFWSQLESIDRELKGLTGYTKKKEMPVTSKPRRAEDVMELIKDLPIDEQLSFQRLFFRSLAGINN